MTKIFFIRAGGLEVWRAMWRGQLSRSTWLQRGPAQAWIDICNRTGEFRA